jgi:hypothetical protein
MIDTGRGEVSPVVVHLPLGSAIQMAGTVEAATAEQSIKITAEKFAEEAERQARRPGAVARAG